MRITQLVLLTAAMLWTMLGLSTTAGADQTAVASAKGSVEKVAPYDEVLESEGLFRHRHARLMRLHQLAMEHGRLVRAGEIERLMDHLGEGHVKSLHERRAQMNVLQKAHVDELLSEHRARSKHVKAELKSHEQTVERHREAREDEAERRTEAMERRAGRLQEERKARAERRDEAAQDHRDADKRRENQHRDVAGDPRKTHQRRARQRAGATSRHHEARRLRREGRNKSLHDDVRSSDKGQHDRQSVKRRRRETDKRDDRPHRNRRASRGYRGPSHQEAREQAERTIKPADADRVFEKLRREIERNR